MIPNKVRPPNDAVKQCLLGIIANPVLPPGGPFSGPLTFLTTLLALFLKPKPPGRGPETTAGGVPRRPDAPSRGGWPKCPSFQPPAFPR